MKLKQLEFEKSDGTIIRVYKSRNGSFMCRHDEKVAQSMGEISAATEDIVTAICNSDPEFAKSTTTMKSNHVRMLSRSINDMLSMM